MTGLLVLGIVAGVVLAIIYSARSLIQRVEWLWYERSGLAAVKNAFAFLEMQGFTLQGQAHPFRKFGTIIHYQKGPIRACVICDRGQWWFTLSLPSIPDSEFDQLLLLSAIGKQSDADLLIGDEYRSLELLGRLVSENISEFIKLLEFDLTGLRTALKERGARIHKELQA